MVGHIQVKDLAWIFEVHPWSLQALPRSYTGWVSQETAMTELTRRGGKTGEITEKEEAQYMEGYEEPNIDAEAQ